MTWIQIGEKLSIERLAHAKYMQKRTSNTCITKYNRSSSEVDGLGISIAT